MLNSSSPVPAAGKTRLSQHFLSVLSCLLLALPALAAASTLVDDLSALSDDELLLLKQLIDAEVEARGLVVPADGMSASDEPLVWIPKSGSKYHSKSTCSNMKTRFRSPFPKRRMAATSPAGSAVRRSERRAFCP